MARSAPGCWVVLTRRHHRKPVSNNERRLPTVAPAALHRTTEPKRNSNRALALPIPWTHKWMILPLMFRSVSGLDLVDAPGALVASRAAAPTLPAADPIAGTIIAVAATARP